MNKTEIRFQDILWALKKHFAWICIVTLVFTVGAWLYTKYAVTPMYRVTTSYCVFSGERDGSVSNNELTGDERLANTYKQLFKSVPVLQAVSDELGGSISANALSGMVGTGSAADTQILYVYVSGTDPQQIYEIANAIAAVAPTLIPEIARAGELTPVNPATVPTTPYSPNMASNVSGGFMLGILLSCAVIVAIAMLDTTIWHEEDLERSFDIPILGTVPSITNAPSNSYRSYEYRR